MKQRSNANLPVSAVFVKYNFMLYTRKGDTGTTKLFDCAQGTKVSKTDFVFEVLGTLDELNSFIGYAKVLSKKTKCMLLMEVQEVSYEEILETLQQNLFCIQAELGGSDIHISKNHIFYLEKIIYEIETVLPPITSFIIPGGGETGAYLDILRTVTRRAERQLIILRNKKERIVSDESITFMNRLSSVFYALARFGNYQQGYFERKPSYK